MPSERSRLFPSAALRGALWITLIALLTTSVALTVQYVQTARLIEARTHALVDDEAAGLIARFRAEGLEGVARAIQREGEVPRLNDFFYLLATPAGRPIVGNLLDWPDEIDRPGYHRFRTEVVSTRAALRERSVEARALVLPGGFRLLVGTLSDERMVLRDRYLSALLWSLLATGLLGLALGFWYSRRGLAFVRAASKVGERFLRGKLEERLPVTGREDEYDRLARTINRSFEEVERLVGSLRAATEGLAHDLKTPITRIRARVELAELERADGERLHEVLAECRQDLEAMLRHIDDALSLARAEATVAESFQPVRLDQIASEAVELFEPVAEERDVHLVSRIAPVTLHGSRSLLAQMITNLIDNAIKYTPAGGRVSIDLEGTRSGVRLTVGDTGPGIPEAERERATHRFARLDSSRAEPGSGIGLSIVAAAARVHRAELSFADNHPGLKVEIHFPQARNEAAGGA